ncbi:MAG: hypothetical protein KA956_00275 [Pyrinomonadaceae bacterium]|nr:hypothetical protein [Acidobacteriota bacterium]MBK7933266.1 hypothetical protein [Acidobacteriota bacterium]MBP7374886.1 hypothetical protein [Pyrinomonadaceae bacterium]
MRHIHFGAAFVIGLTLFAGAATAQKKTTKKPVPKKPPVTKTVVPPLEVRVAREKVDTQLGNVNRFVDVLGPIVQSIEDIDAESRTKRLPPSTLATNEANKKKVVEAIRNMRAGLAILESEFRTKASLSKYLPSIQGITDLAAASEDSAIAGRFIAAKEPLRDVAKKLTDTLAAMPL